MPYLSYCILSPKYSPCMSDPATTAHSKRSRPTLQLLDIHMDACKLGRHRLSMIAATGCASLSPSIGAYHGSRARETLGKSMNFTQFLCTARQAIEGSLCPYSTSLPTTRSPRHYTSFVPRRRCLVGLHRREETHRVRCSAPIEALKLWLRS